MNINLNEIRDRAELNYGIEKKVMFTERKAFAWRTLMRKKKMI